MVGKKDTYAAIRREYGALSLDNKKLESSPIAQFNLWFKEILATEIDDPTAMVLSTVDELGRPDSRVVLLKGIEDGAFIFYSNYESTKAKQLQKNPFAALNFYWPKLSRQVRIRGELSVLSPDKSDAYFATRPFDSQISAITSKQSRPLENLTALAEAVKKMSEKEKNKIIKRPNYWGGYLIKPFEMEFWQGKDNRLHDRVFYYLENNHWQHYFLAP